MKPISERSKFVLSVVITFACFAIGAWLMVEADVDDRHPLTPRMASITMIGMALLMLVAIAWAAAVIWRCGQIPMRGGIFLIAVLPFGLSFVVFGGIRLMNVRLDGTGVDYELTVADAFVIQHGNYEAKYLALAVPEKFGGTRVWGVQQRVDLNDYPPGTKVTVTHHDGALGIPWFQYHDRNIDRSAWLTTLRYRRGGTAASRAQGRFSPNSPVRRQIEEWGVPVMDADPP